MLNLVERELRRLWIDDGGQGLTEYALILGLIVLAAVGGVTLLGQSVLNLFEYVADKEIFNATLPVSKF
ncbi:Flp family type IVb pilin [Natranaerofaba carboxydovora]|uniref:Flp family type IVb pilin n=1 Tax=Natranaerofaba carboxydovora TaxID=2742683 RepID=UPI001F140DC8|nr:hypothetical protein [Natranaerofaba carboxydovora]UMZ75038.1 hypothetical protein ACONDI_02649 [Natranaerofaba carboxydovora]